MALFDYAINEKCYSVYGGRAFALFFRPHPGGFDSSRVPTPANLPSKAKKMLMPRGLISVMMNLFLAKETTGISQSWYCRSYD